MTRFRSPKKQAEHAINELNAIGAPRHNNKNDGLIHSIRTSINYTQVTKTFLEWGAFYGLFYDLSCATELMAGAFLSERSEQIVQTHLDVERRALELGLSVKIDKIKSLICNKPTQKCYTDQQIQMIANHQTPRNQYSTLIAAKTGVRAHELFTFQIPDKQPPSKHRQWSKKRFIGLNNYTHLTVCGKGGLIRSVAIPNELYEAMHERKLQQPKKVMDRGITYLTHFDLGGGQAWSQSFASASMRILGWSTGGHSLRHEFARHRMEKIQSMGINYFDARKIVSEELGHFRGSITEHYIK